ncbi:hypothetical protein [Pseudarthrobacter sp. YAF2]|uniref:hypothetical protein n=1 Tax=Pseudarthrobacter sp. YAF2 TaxID=3233078 RepID=UPI003F9DDA1B
MDELAQVAPESIGLLMQKQPYPPKRVIGVSKIALRRKKDEVSMKKRLLHTQPAGKNAFQTRTAKTGEHCPMTGFWAPADLNGNRLVISEGEIMPSNQGESATWILVTGLIQALEPNALFHVAKGFGVGY